MHSAVFAKKLLAVSLVAMMAGCGQVDSLLVMGSNSSSSSSPLKSKPPSQSQFAKFFTGEKTDAVPSGLSKEDNPVVFLESAAQFAEQNREYETAAKHWSHLASIEPTNMTYVTRMAANLRTIDRHEDAERMLRQALRDNPNHADLTEELAKTMIASGRLRDGVVLIERLAAAPDVTPDRAARLHSAMGVAFDRAEKHQMAQAEYQLALKAQPYNAFALNNLGLSYAMEGKLDAAERTLRRALVAPDAGTQVRQNLALVLALKGNTVEAERLASQDLPASLVKETVDFYGGIADQRALWKNASAQ